VRVVGEGFEQGVYPIAKALKIAREIDWLSFIISYSTFNVTSSYEKTILYVRNILSSLCLIFLS